MVDRRPLTAAYQAAAETHERLGTDQTQRVDVYGAMDRLGLFLAFRPLDQLLGVSLPNSGGVMVTSSRGSGVQRYTAAHELGHCVMHHPGLLLDGEFEVSGGSAVETERQAQMFAAYFLMPPELAHRVADEYRIAPGTATPGRLYLAARDMGVSYEAAVRHLGNLDRVAREAVEQLVANQRRAKRDAAFGFPAARGTKDVWPVRATTAGSTLDVTIGDEVFIRLPENRSTGYRWREAGRDTQRRPSQAQGSISDHVALQDASTARAALQAVSSTVGPAASRTDDAGLRVALDEYRSPLATRRPVTTRRDRAREGNMDVQQPPVVGVAGERFLGVTAEQVGQSTLELILARPHQADTDAVARWPLTLHIAPTPAEQRIQQILATDLSADPLPSWTGDE